MPLLQHPEVHAESSLQLLPLGKPLQLPAAHIWVMQSALVQHGSPAPAVSQLPLLQLPLQHAESSEQATPRARPWQTPPMHSFEVQSLLLQQGLPVPAVWHVILVLPLQLSLQQAELLLHVLPAAPHASTHPASA